MEVDMTLVHAAHCCTKHGCKYGANACPVVEKVVQQEHPCEFCEMDDSDAAPVVEQIVSWLGARIAELETQARNPYQDVHIAVSAHNRAHHYKDIVRGLREGAWKA